MKPLRLEVKKVLETNLKETLLLMEKTLPRSGEDLVNFPKFCII